MTWTLMDSHSVGLFCLYFVTGVALWVTFNRIYLWLTPYDEHADILAGKMAPAIALVGAEIGFVLPLSAASAYGGGLLGFIVWGVLAGAVQLGCFKLMYWRMPHAIPDDNKAVALNFAGASVCLGFINAISMIP